MNLIKRCYGCGRPLYPWQDIVRTKLVGKIHRGCAFDADIKHSYEEETTKLRACINRKALKALNEEENT